MGTRPVTFNMPSRFAKVIAICAIVILSLSAAASAEDESLPTVTLSPGFKFTETSGEQLFAGVCQGCHMPDGHGAIGAGSYPSIANDGNLEAKGYPLAVVVRGQRAMPAIGWMMSDDQVAAVVNYVRTHFGNRYRDVVTSDDVKLVRP
jgi:mono/diheme cytochrome c family protein